MVLLLMRLKNPLSCHLFVLVIEIYRDRRIILIMKFYKSINREVERLLWIFKYREVSIGVQKNMFVTSPLFLKVRNTNNISRFHSNVYIMYASHLESSFFLASPQPPNYSSFEAVMLCCPFIIMNLSNFMSFHEADFFFSNFALESTSVRHTFCCWLWSLMKISCIFTLYDLFL